MRIIVQHRLERQETPQDPVSAETVSCSWTRDPTRTVWHFVPEVELCPGALLCNTANTDAGITSAGTYIVNLFGTYVRIIKLPTQRNLQCVELCRQVKQTDMNISYRRLLKPKKFHKTILFCSEIIV